jgi:hypothetical protein
VPGLFSYACHPPMRRPIVLFAFALSAVMPATPVARAHAGGEPLLIVPDGTLEPSASFELIAADLGPDTQVEITISIGATDIPLATITAGSDGHFTTTLQLPADFPAGYAQIVASGADGSTASVWVCVGADTCTGAPPPKSSSAPPLWLDPAVILLSAVLAVSGAALAMQALRSARKRA